MDPNLTTPAINQEAIDKLVERIKNDYLTESDYLATLKERTPEFEHARSLYRLACQKIEELEKRANEVTPKEDKAKVPGRGENVVPVTPVTPVTPIKTETPKSQK